MKYFITGASGFIGQYLAKTLNKMNHEVYELETKLSDANNLADCLSHFNPDYVIHLAAKKKRSSDANDFSEIIESNLIGTFNLLNASKRLNSVKKILIMGTAEEYGQNKSPFFSDMREDPISFYSFSKMTATHLAQMFYKLYDLPITILRPSIAYGPGQAQDMFIPSLISTLKSKKSFAMTSGEQKRQFIYIEDLVSAILEISEKVKPAGQIINISHQEQFSIKDVAQNIAAKLDAIDLLEIGKLPTRQKEIVEYRLDTSFLNHELGWKPKYTFEQGISETLKSY